MRLWSSLYRDRRAFQARAHASSFSCIVASTSPNPHFLGSWLRLFLGNVQRMREQHATPLMAKNKLGADLHALLSQGPAVAAFLESLFSER